MAFELPGIDLGNKTALGDYSSSSLQYTCVTSTSDNDVSRQVTAGGKVLGILQNQPSSGQAAVVRYCGFSKVWVHSTAAAVTVGDALTCTTSGGVETVANALSSFIVGYAAQSATTTAGLITVQLAQHSGGSTAA